MSRDVAEELMAACVELACKDLKNIYKREMSGRGNLSHEELFEKRSIENFIMNSFMVEWMLPKFTGNDIISGIRSQAKKELNRR